MPKPKLYTEKQLAALAKRLRLKTGSKKAPLARKLGITRATLQDAEERRSASLTKVRCRIIEYCSLYRVVGPVFFLVRK